VRSSQQNDVDLAFRQLLARGPEAQAGGSLALGHPFDDHRGGLPLHHVLTDGLCQGVRRRRGRSDLAPEDGIEAEHDPDPQAHDAVAEHLERLVERGLRQRQHPVGAHQVRIEGWDAPEGHRLLFHVEQWGLVEADDPRAQQEGRVARGRADGRARPDADDDGERVQAHSLTSRTETFALST
jgi:hypothetical protein